MPENHPINKIRRIVDKAISGIEAEIAGRYVDFGRPSVPSEQLIRAQFLQIFYTIRSERQLVECIDYDWLFRWFVGLDIDEKVWDHTTFTKNRDRLLCEEIANAALLTEIFSQHSCYEKICRLIQQPSKCIGRPLQSLRPPALTTN